MKDEPFLQAASGCGHSEGAGNQPSPFHPARSGRLRQDRPAPRFDVDLAETLNEAKDDDALRRSGAPQRLEPPMKKPGEEHLYTPDPEGLTARPMRGMTIALVSRYLVTHWIVAS